MVPGGTWRMFCHSEESLCFLNSQECTFFHLRHPVLVMCATKRVYAFQLPFVNAHTYCWLHLTHLVVMVVTGTAKHFSPDCNPVTGSGKPASGVLPSSGRQWFCHPPAWLTAHLCYVQPPLYILPPQDKTCWLWKCLTPQIVVFGRPLCHYATQLHNLWEQNRFCTVKKVPRTPKVSAIAPSSSSQQPGDCQISSSRIFPACHISLHLNAQKSRLSGPFGELCFCHRKVTTFTEPCTAKLQGTVSNSTLRPFWLLHIPIGRMVEKGCLLEWTLEIHSSWRMHAYESYLFHTIHTVLWCQTLAPMLTKCSLSKGVVQVLPQQPNAVGASWRKKSGERVRYDCTSSWLIFLDPACADVHAFMNYHNTHEQKTFASNIVLPGCLTFFEFASVRVLKFWEL